MTVRTEEHLPEHAHGAEREGQKGMTKVARA